MARDLNPNLEVQMSRRFLSLAAGGVAAVAAVLIGCAEGDTPSEVIVREHHAAAPAAKGYINGWLEGRDVNLFYARPYFCEEPPVSGADTPCVLGAEATVRPGPEPIPPLYTIAAIGFQPDSSTLSCQAGTPCINHPAMIDASRVFGPGAINVPGPSHSHIVESQSDGWHRTVNIRVFNLDVWNQIAAAKTLEKVRELQADPAVGGAGLISADTPTNIFFFIKVKEKVQ
jgi:hypothetical protein